MGKVRFGGIVIDTDKLPEEGAKLEIQKAKSDADWKKKVAGLNKKITDEPQEKDVY